jgi:hypothetical protein
VSRRLAGRRGAPASNLREVIDLASHLWDIERRHLLGALSRAEYRQAVAAVRASANRRALLPERRKNDA